MEVLKNALISLLISVLVVVVYHFTRPKQEDPVRLELINKINEVDKNIIHSDSIGDNRGIDSVWTEFTGRLND